jgi:uncharacterized membrane protein YidH (DUF202 family)
MSQPLAGSPIAHELRPWVARMVRIGYAAKGVIYLLIGVLAFRLAAGLGGGRLVDPAEALRILFQQPFGEVLLAIVAVGILSYSLWQFVEAIWDTRRKGGGWGLWDRALTMIKGAAYATVGWQAARLVLGLRRSQDDLAAQVISFPLGGVFLALVGIGVAIYGAFEVKDAIQARFGEDLDAYRLRLEAGRWATAVGRIGNGARGVILVMMGMAFAAAGLQRNPAKAGGISDALEALFSQPYGVALAASVAAGLACFGFFQLLHARYARL